MYILVTFSLLLLLGPYCVCPLSCPSLHEWSPGYLQLSGRHLYSFPFYCFPLLLCTLHLKGFLISPCSSLELCLQLDIAFPFPLALLFSYFLTYFWSLLRQPLCLLAFLFLWNGFGHYLLHNVTNFCPWLLRHSVYHISSLESIHPLQCIIIRDLI